MLKLKSTEMKFHMLIIAISHVQFIMENQRPKLRTLMKDDCIKTYHITVLLLFLTLPVFMGNLLIIQMQHCHVQIIPFFIKHILSVYGEADTG